MYLFHNPQQIKQFLTILTEPFRQFNAWCVELRVPKTFGRSYGVVAGHYTDLDKLCSACRHWSGKTEAVYVTLNPVKPELLGDGPNDWRTFAKGLAGDKDILRRFWLPIDIDAIKRPTESATDVEHQTALEKIKRAREHLTDFGFPAGLMASSGNGGHLLYRIDLPNDDETTGLIGAFYGALNGAGQNVDTAVGNAGRIWKVYGTLAAKGQEIDGRKHRLAEILDCPEKLEVIPLAKLQEYVAKFGEPMKPIAGSAAGNGQAPADAQSKAEWLEQFLQKHDVKTDRQESGPDGRRVYWLAVCPFCESTDSGRPIVTADAAGYGFKCLHNRCSGKTWRDFRKHFEPEYMADEPKKRGRPDTAKTLVKLAEDLELWHSPDMTAYASIIVNGHAEHWPLNSPEFDRWLTGLAFNKLDIVPDDRTINKVLGVLGYKAIIGPKHTVYRRVARVAEHIYIDLANAHWQAIEIDANGWRIVDRPRVKFKRVSYTGELPKPVSGGNLDGLRKLSATTDEGWILFLGFLLDCLKGHPPYFVLSVTGEEGSAKSTLVKEARWLVDPFTDVDLTSRPRSDEALAVNAINEYLLAYDNVSVVPDWLSDLFCQVASGGGLKCRKLYSATEQTIYKLASPIAMNGIPDYAEAGDLLNRCLLVRQPRIDEDQRLTEADVEKEFARIKAGALGALCDLVSGGLRRLEQTKLDRLPRMADSARWITACLGDDSFIRQHRQNVDEGRELALEASPVAVAIRDFINGKSNREWQGQPTELLDILTERQNRLSRDWPTNGKALTDRLKRAGVSLRSAGIDFHIGKSNGVRYVRLFKIDVAESPVADVYPQPAGEPEQTETEIEQPLASIPPEQSPVDYIVEPIGHRWRGGWRLAGWPASVRTSWDKEFEDEASAREFANRQNGKPLAV